MDITADEYQNGMFELDGGEPRLPHQPCSDGSLGARIDESMITTQHFLHITSNSNPRFTQVQTCLSPTWTTQAAPRTWAAHRSAPSLAPPSSPAPSPRAQPRESRPRSRAQTCDAPAPPAYSQSHPNDSSSSETHPPPLTR